MVLQLILQHDRPPSIQHDDVHRNKLPLRLLIQRLPILVQEQHVGMEFRKHRTHHRRTQPHVPIRPRRTTRPRLRNTNLLLRHRLELRIRVERYQAQHHRRKSQHHTQLTKQRIHSDEHANSTQLHTQRTNTSKLHTLHEQYRKFRHEPKQYRRRKHDLAHKQHDSHVQHHSLNRQICLERVPADIERSTIMRGPQNRRSRPKHRMITMNPKPPTRKHSSP